MVKIIAEIIDNQQIEFDGDVRVTGNIGKNAKVIIKDGDLVVEGNIEDHAKISIASRLNNRLNWAAIYTPNIKTGPNFLSVSGNVGNHVKIDADNADIKINGNVGNHCVLKSEQGEISTGNIGNDTLLEMQNGVIWAGDVGVASRVISHIGAIYVGYVSEYAVITNHNGDLYYMDAPLLACITAHQGAAMRREPKVPQSPTSILASFAHLWSSIFSTAETKATSNPTTTETLTLRSKTP